MPLPEPVAPDFPRRRRPLEAIAAALRPRQWTKNLFLLAGIVFAGEVGDADRWARALLAFGVYCAASSAAYLVNDVRDVAGDRLHPTKRRRPVARGELSGNLALALAAALAGASAVGAVLLGRASLLFLTAFLALQLLYSLLLKRVPLLDLTAIAALFVLRAAAGAAAIHVRASPWLLACTALLALFLGLAKRRGELTLVRAHETPMRPALSGWSLQFLDRLLVAVAAAATAVYSVYAATVHTRLMLATVPFVVLGISRYLVLVQRRGLGEEPEEILLHDAPIVVAVALWVAVSAVVLAGVR